MAHIGRNHRQIARAQADFAPLRINGHLSGSAGEQLVIGVRVRRHADQPAVVLRAAFLDKQLDGRVLHMDAVDASIRKVNLHGHSPFV